MPAQSPTLSPTLSAITAGLRGSSSGMPASTLPTRSAPTSAPLVKMPPPRRAKIEISEEPKAKPSSGLSAAESTVGVAAGQVPEEDADAEQAQADDQHAGDRAALEGDVERRADALGGGLRGAHVGAHRDVHADEAAGAREHRAEHEADGGEAAEEDGDQDREHHADDARWSCTGAPGRRRRLAGSPRRSPACGRCPRPASGSSCAGRSRRARRRGRTPARCRAPSWSTSSEFLPRSIVDSAFLREPSAGVTARTGGQTRRMLRDDAKARDRRGRVRGVRVRAAATAA